MSCGRLRVARRTITKQAVTSTPGRSEIQRIHQKFADTPYEANRILGLLSKMFNLAELWGFRSEHTNPCRLIPRFPEKPRERFLTIVEVQRLNDAMAQALDDNQITLDMAAAVRLLLLTGARVGEILGAEWNWVDWERKIIALPDSKTGAKLIFLSEQALVVLRHLQLRQGHKAHRFVIRGRLAGQRLVNLAGPWDRLRRHAKLPDVRLHDLRHTAASVGVANGLSLPLVGRLLGHTQAQTTLRYAHVDIDPALVAANTIGQSLSLLTRGLSGQGDAMGNSSG